MLDNTRKLKVNYHSSVSIDMIVYNKYEFRLCSALSILNNETKRDNSIVIYALCPVLRPVLLKSSKVVLIA